jgi:predicted nuclease of predicted toxin-antitoxin system
MNFLLDAHLPRRLKQLLIDHGHDALHTFDLPRKNATSDAEINQISVEDQRVVITKDTDFFYSHLLEHRPWKLLLVRTGNMSTRDLCALFERHLPQIESALQQSSLVEIDHAAVKALT